MTKSGKLILILWSSWVWKWTLISLLRKREQDFFFPISCTTRDPREWEFDWWTYYFLSKEEFEDKIKNWEMLEYALVHWKAYYWLMKGPILDAINEWKTVIREIDVQGFDSICKILNEKIFWSIFIDVPKKIELLKERIRNRAPIAESELNARMDSIKKESLYKFKTDFVITNIEDWVEEMYDDLLEKIEELTK